MVTILKARGDRSIRSFIDPEKGTISRNTSFVNDLNADSLDTVELVMEFEDEFETNIPDDKAEQIKTVGEAIKFILEAKKSAAA